MAWLPLEFILTASAKVLPPLGSGQFHELSEVEGELAQTRELGVVTRVWKRRSPSFLRSPNEYNPEI